jgi:hypothetical protein
MPQSENIRIKPAVNYRLAQYKKKNKLKNKSEAIEHLLANDSLGKPRSHIAEPIFPDEITQYEKQGKLLQYLNQTNPPKTIN